ncbi:glycerophosphodiester phosphodiesterase [Clostridium oceanicum]|uniref:Glycerophosphodiester phosphodiesterase n=1 Tax=Clostridium oceanicum TaxID=1543 RepID=A0ABP3UGR2_9CLOT
MNLKKKYTSIFYILKRSFKCFKKSFYINIGFEAMFKVITSFIFIPFVTVVFNYFVYISKFDSITNKQILSFIGSIPGILTILILGIAMFIFVFIEFGGLIIISSQAYFERVVSARDAFLTSLKNIKGIMSIGFIPILTYVFFIVPFSIGLGFSSDIIPNVEIPSFILDVVYKSVKWTSLYILVLFIANYFLIRWIFAMHCVILEGKNFSKALKRSSKLVKGSFFKILFSLLLLNLIIMIVLGLIFLLFIFVINIFEYNLHSNKNLYLAIISFVTTIGFIIALLLGLLILPLNIIMITQLYYEQVEIKDSVEPTYLHIKANVRKINWKALFNRHKKKLISMILLLIMFFSGIIYFYLTIKDVGNLRNITVTAHRGDAVNAPDNTMSSLLGAIKNKADYSELDVQETKDGVVVLTHDTNLKETAGINKSIWELTYSQVEKLEVGSHFSSKFAGEKIPTLESIIKAADKKIKLNIELKLNGHEKHLEKSVVKLIEDNNFIDKCVVTSLDYKALQKVKKLNSKIKTGYIMFISIGDISSLNVDFFSVEASVATPDFIERVRNNNKKIHVWTVNDTETMRKFIDLKVDSIITDDPIQVKTLLQEKKKEDPSDPLNRILKLIEE